MFHSEMKKIKETIEKLENELCPVNANDEGTKVFLDFNRDGTKNPEKIYLLCTIPPRSKWKCK